MCKKPLFFSPWTRISHNSFSFFSRQRFHLRVNSPNHTLKRGVKKTIHKRQFVFWERKNKGNLIFFLSQQLKPIPAWSWNYQQSRISKACCHFASLPISLQFFGATRTFPLFQKTNSHQTHNGRERALSWAIDVFTRFQKLIEQIKTEQTEPFFIYTTTGSLSLAIVYAQGLVFSEVIKHLL